MPNVYVPERAPPEVEAYAMARYSRSADSLADSQRAITADQAGTFLDTYYFDYGHKSIADLAHTRLAVENVSLLAAVHVVDEPLWDGQERSTRYTSFATPTYHTPEMRSPALRRLYADTIRDLYEAYRTLTELLPPLVAQHHRRPTGLSEDRYRRAIAARVFDVTRNLLPLATHTSLGQVTSARTLERQIARLRASAYPEVSVLGDDMLSAISGELPTLVKHAEPDDAQARVDAAVAPVAGDLYERRAARRPWLNQVSVGPIVTPTEELVATLIFAATAHPYVRCCEVVRNATEPECAAVVEAATGALMTRDELPRAFRVGAGFNLEMVLDVGSFRDLHRHRRCIQLWHPPDGSLSYQWASSLFEQALGSDIADAAVEEHLHAVYDHACDKAFAAHDQLAGAIGPEAAYVLPLAARLRALFKMDLAELAYIADLRTRPSGHFAYRRFVYAAWKMALQRDPLLTTLAHPQDPEADDPTSFFAR